MGKETKRPKKKAPNQSSETRKALKKTSEVYLSASEQLAYEDYAAKRKLEEIAILDAEYDGKISEASFARERLDKLEEQYSSNPKFAQKYEIEREKQYIKLKKEANKHLKKGNMEEYNTSLSAAQEEARFMSKEQLERCENRLNNDRLAEIQKQAGKLVSKARATEDAKFLRVHSLEIERR